MILNYFLSSYEKVYQLGYKQTVVGSYFVMTYDPRSNQNVNLDYYNVTDWKIIL